MTHFSLRNRRTLTATRFSIRKIIALSLCLGLFPSSFAFSQEKGAQHKPASESEETRLLEKGNRLERETSAQTTHAYTIALSTGQFLRVKIDQRGADVVLTLIDPDLKRIVEANNPNGTRGNESLLHIAETSGNYRLEIRTTKTDKQTGRYEVIVEELHQAEPRDKSRVISQRAFLAGEHLRLQNNPDAWRKAMAKYEEALNFAREAEDKKEEASMLTYLGGVSNYLGERKKAIDYFSQALSLFQSLKDVLAEASTTGNIAYSYHAMSNFEKAVEFYNKALVLRQSQNDKRGVALSLHNLGSVTADLRNFGKALEYYSQALEIVRVIEDKSFEGSTLHQFGTIHYQLGDFEKAIDYWNQALTIRREIGEHTATLMTLNNLASAYSILGENEKAIEIYRDIIPRARAAYQKNAEALALSNLGRSLGALGNHKEAMGHFEQALEIFRTIGHKRFEVGVLRNIGDTYISLGDYEKASEYMNQSLALAKATLDETAQANATIGFALIDKKRGNLTEAGKKVDSIIEFYENRRPTIHIQDLRNSSFAQLHDYYSLKIDLLMQEHHISPQTGRDREAFQMAERARARALIEMLREARADIRRGVAPDLLEREKLMQKELNTKSEAVLRLLSTKAAEDKISAARKETESTRTQLQEVQAQIRARSPSYASLTQPQPLELADIQKQVLDPDTTLLEYSLGKERSYLWVVTQTTLHSFELPSAQKIEEAAKRVYDLLTARNKVVKFETTDEKAARVEQTESDFYQAARSLSEMILDPACHFLKSRRLLIVADGALQYIPFSVLPSPLFEKPEMEAKDKGQGTKDSHRPLILDHEVVSLPSASTLAVMRNEMAGRKPAPKAMAIFADPVFESDDVRVKDGLAKAEDAAKGAMAVRKKRSPASNVSRSARDTGYPEDGVEMCRLPFTRKEAQTIASLVPASELKIAMDFEASRDAATNPELSNYRYIHFATHSLINSRQPELSGLVLSLVDERGEERDGFLRAHEIYNLNLPAELVVLSGCQTGLGKQIRGEGVIGITRGFMYAGAARVMVSLWDVNDEATSELMSRFYRNMLGKKRLRPAEALRAAQVSMWKDARWRSPYYWAAFILQGEPN